MEPVFDFLRDYIGSLRAANRLRSKWPNVILVHTPLHASWINRSSSIFFQHRYETLRVDFTRRDLHNLLAKLASKSDRLVA
jgi:hypothetical protein